MHDCQLEAPEMLLGFDQCVDLSAHVIAIERSKNILVVLESGRKLIDQLLEYC